MVQLNGKRHKKIIIFLLLRALKNFTLNAFF